MLVERVIKGAFAAFAPRTVHSKQGRYISDGKFVRSCNTVFSPRLFALEGKIPTSSDNISIFSVEFCKLHEHT